MLEGPSDYARKHVALDVDSCNGEDDKLVAIGKHDYYLREGYPVTSVVYSTFEPVSY